MANNNHRIFILEDDACFRGVLEAACFEIGDVVAVADKESALEILSKQTFNLILLDWYLCQEDSESFISAVHYFQPDVRWIALFTVTDLNNIKAAMKAGANDVLWPVSEKKVILVKLKENLKQKKLVAFAHSTLNGLAQSLVEKALSQKATLYEARREFSKHFLEQILSQQKLRRSELAHLLHVSPRTLDRHLSA
jgi:DNA-binding NtrC family response regulator